MQIQLNKKQSLRTEPLRIYFQLNDEYRKFLQLFEYRLMQMHIKLYGLNSNDAQIIGNFEDRILSDKQLQTIHYKWNEMKRVNDDIDYISMHDKDMVFSIKLRNGARMHTLGASKNLTSNSGVFLHFQMLSDIPVNYLLSTNKPKKPNIIYSIQEKSILNIHGYFSGISFDLFSYVMGTLKNDKRNLILCQLDGKSMKGILVCSEEALDTIILTAKPHGYIISFFFPIDTDKNLVKTFLVT